MQITIDLNELNDAERDRLDPILTRLYGKGNESIAGRGARHHRKDGHRG